MKKICLLFVVLLTSCTNIVVHKIGKMNMVSNRNIDTGGEYILLRNYMGASEKEIEETTNLTLEDALDQTVKNTPGGEFLKNAKFYLVIRDDQRYYAVEGDVWGTQGEENFRGFKVGDKVQWKSFLSIKSGTITNLKNSTECVIQEDESNTIMLIEYDELLKIK